MTPVEELNRAVELALSSYVKHVAEMDDQELPPDDGSRAEALKHARDAIVALFTGHGVDTAGVPPLVPARYRLPTERVGVTRRVTIHAAESHTFYLTTGNYPDGRIGELFIREKREEASYTGGLLDALATVASIGLQHGIPWDVFSAKLERQRFEPSGLTDDEHPELRFVSSPVDYIARFIRLQQGRPR